MKKLFAYANAYARKSTWKEFALVKLCLCAVGILLGTAVPAERKKSARAAAAAVFAATYIPLMLGFCKGLEKK